MTRILRDAGATSQRDDPTASDNPHTTTQPESALSFVPILDVARGIPAGFQAVVGANWSPNVLQLALTAFATLPPNTFISIPIPLGRLRDPEVRAVLSDQGTLAGIVLDITHFAPAINAATEAALQAVRKAGALLSVGGRETAQPELGSIVRLRPSIVRLGRAWIEGLDQSPTKRAAIEVTGRLTAQLDARLLAESVSSSAELRALSELGVPLAQGPFIGPAHLEWSHITPTVTNALSAPTGPRPS